MADARADSSLGGKQQRASIFKAKQKRDLGVGGNLNAAIDTRHKGGILKAESLYKDTFSKWQVRNYGAEVTG